MFTYAEMSETKALKASIDSTIRVAVFSENPSIFSSCFTVISPSRGFREEQSNFARFTPSQNPNTPLAHMRFAISTSSNAL